MMIIESYFVEVNLQDKNYRRNLRNFQRLRIELFE